MKRIFIDAGHGGADSGAVGNGLKEKDVTLAIALQTGDILQRNYEGYIVKLSRTSDVTLSLIERTMMANRWGADFLLSIHSNAGGGTGFESFMYKGNSKTRGQSAHFQQIIHQEIVNETGFHDRGRKEANFHMLRESTMIAMLVENGFIDHRIDAGKLNNPQFIERVATGHAVGLAKALGLRKRTNPNWYIIKKGDTLWRIAQDNHTTVDHLLKLNPGVQPRRLKIGETIRMFE